MLIPLLNDCVRVLDEAGVTPEDLDTGMQLGAGWPMGPCALLDLVGADVHVHASEALYEKLREPRMAPPPRLVRMLKAGKLGRKTRRGLLHLRLTATSGAAPSLGAWRCATSAAGCCSRASGTAPGAATGATRPVCAVCEPVVQDAGWVRVVDAYEHVRVTGLTQTVRRVA